MYSKDADFTVESSNPVASGVASGVQLLESACRW